MTMCQPPKPREFPAYAYCSCDAFMWVPLLEKAYAKIHRCYENIDGGFSNCAMMDLTGGYIMGIDLQDETSSPVLSIKKFINDEEAANYLSILQWKDNG